MQYHDFQEVRTHPQSHPFQATGNTPIEEWSAVLKEEQKHTMLTYQVCWQCISAHLYCFFTAQDLFAPWCLRILFLMCGLFGCARSLCMTLVWKWAKALEITLHSRPYWKCAMPATASSCAPCDCLFTFSGPEGRYCGPPCSPSRSKVHTQSSGHRRANLTSGESEWTGLFD